MKTILLCGLIACAVSACGDKLNVVPTPQTQLPICRDGAVPPSCIEEPAPWPDGKPK